MDMEDIKFITIIFLVGLPSIFGALNAVISKTGSFKNNFASGFMLGVGINILYVLVKFFNGETNVMGFGPGTLLLIDGVLIFIGYMIYDKKENTNE